MELLQKHFILLVYTNLGICLKCWLFFFPIPIKKDISHSEMPLSNSQQL